MKNYHRVLSIAGSDSGGCAGIQADLKTCSALNCFGMTAITALTAQNTLQVEAIQSIPPEFVKLQIQAVITDIGVDAIKIGMLDNNDVIVAVRQALLDSSVPIVLDPVMVSSSGDQLLAESAINQLRSQLFPLACLITPNITEAEWLIGYKIQEVTEIEYVAQALAEQFQTSVLLKGGHWQSVSASDYLYDVKSKDGYWLHSGRIATNNTHGTGCTLSAAIACELAKGHSLLQSVTAAKQFIDTAILLGSQYQLGKGHGPVFHLRP